MNGDTPKNPAPAPEDPPLIGIRDILVAARRRWLLGTLIFALGMGATYALTRYSAVLYRSTASVLIENASKSILAAPDQSAVLSQDVTKAQKILAESRPVIMRALNGCGVSGPEMDKLFSSDTMPPANFDAHIDGQLLYLEVLSESPARAAVLSNAWSQAFIDEMTRRAKAPNIYAKDFLDKSLPDLRQDWVAKQEALNKFEQETRFDPKEFDQHPLRKRVADLSNKINALNIELTGLEAEADATTRPNIGTDDLIRLTRAKTDPVLVGLQKQLEERTSKLMDAMEKLNPESQAVRAIQENVEHLRADIKKAGEAIVTQIKLDLERYRSELKRLQLQYDDADKAFEVLKTNASRHSILKSEMEMAGKLYAELAEKKSVSELTGRFEYSYATRWEQGEAPLKPAKPRWTLNFAIGLFLSIALSVTAIFLAERLNDTVRSGGDLEHALQGAQAKMVPRFRKSLGDAYSLAARQPGVAAAAALRNIAVGIELKHGATKPLTVTVTSPGAGEGKSFLASNLAGLFASSGHRVLLVDADLHKASLSRALKHEGKKGLSDLLAGAEWSPQFAQDGTVAGLHFLPAGARPASNPASLNPDSFRAAIERLKTAYDVIVMDTPPVLAVADASIAAQASDVTILAARSGKTRLIQFERAAAALHDINAKELLFVVNAVAAIDSEDAT